MTVRSGGSRQLVDQRRGLTPAQARARLLADGPNELPHPRRDSLARQVARQVFDVVVLVLLVAGVLTAAVGDVADTSVIALVIVVNTVLGVTQERRSGRVLEALSGLTAPRATVVRAGEAVDVDAREVVVGDLMALRAGDIVPADGEVLDAEAMQADESAMTGESLPVTRTRGERVLAGTVVTRGRGHAVVSATAGRTRLAGLARASAGPPTATPLQRQLQTLGRGLAIAVSVAALVVVVIGIASGRSVETSVVVGLSLAVAAIPESLPAVVTLSLAMAARRMAGEGVLIRRLPAVEALGSVTTLATDKTGTLTTGVMTVSSSWVAPGTDERHVLELVALCNDAPATVPDVRDPRTDPTDAALVAAAVAAGIDVGALRTRHPRTGAEPFDARTARMTTAHHTAGGPALDICKGAPEAVAGLVVDDGGDRPREMLAAAERLAASGARVLAVAERDREPWCVAGLVALTDPLRPDAAAFVDAFRAAGVRVVMITGDHAETARTVADALGIDAETEDRPAAVFARVRPEEKSAIVERLRSSGAVVAMTGDGVNDAPALRRADVGVAMGVRGTEVARQAADLVLTGDDLGSLGHAIAEGRRVYDNLRRFLHFGLAGGFAEVAVMLLGPALGHVVPLGAGQILWINLLTHGATGVAMGNEPAEADVMTRPPRPPRERLLDAATAIRILVTGTAVTVAGLTAATVVERWGGSWSAALFATLTLAQLAVAVGLRPWSAPWSANPLLPASVVLNIGLLLGALYLAPLQELLHTTSLSATHLGLCALFAVVVGAVASVVGNLRGGSAVTAHERTFGPGPTRKRG